MDEVREVEEGARVRDDRVRGRWRWLDRVLMAAPCLLIVCVPLGGQLWVADLVCNLAAQAAGMCAAGMVIGAARRRWVLTGVSLVAIVAAAWLMAGPRAARDGAASEIRILHANVMASNPLIDDAERFVLGGGHDIVTLLELPRPLSRGVRAGTASDRYPHMRTSAPIAGHAGWVTVLSVWALEPWGDAGADDRTGTLCVVARTPDGPVGIVGMHASSPWAPRRWRVGNESARRAAGIAREMRAAGLPVIMVGDLNSTPTGARSRRLVRETGFRRCKPARVMAGTYPAWLAWPLRAAIDDALVSEEFGVTEWRAVACPGSDHLAVEIGLSMRRE